MTQDELDELRAIAASELMIPFVPRHVLRELLDAYDEIQEAWAWATHGAPEDGEL